MVWLNPLALVALASVAAPVLIHILVHRHAERFPFPTLRFLRPTRLAAIRRSMLDDLPLLAVRAALIAAAVAALAGPLLVTSARTAAWNRRVARATVTDGLRRPPVGGEGNVLQRTFENTGLSDGIRRAILWLETAPPAKREIVVASRFPIGSITAEDIAAIPAGIGIRFERVGALPAERTIAAGHVLTPTGVGVREVTLHGRETSVREVPGGDLAASPVDIVSAAEDRAAVDATIAAVLSQHVWAGPADRRARVVLLAAAATQGGKIGTRTAVVQAFPPVTSDAGGVPRGAPKPVGEGGTSDVAAELSSASAIDRVWMADAVVRMAGDSDLRAAAERVAAGLADARFASAPWQRLASAADGGPLIVAARSSDRLLIASAAPAANLVTPLLLRSIANATVDLPDLRGDEVVPIADSMLQQWSRPPAAVTTPRLDTVDRDDRRWLWASVLALLVLESWIRRARSVDVPNTSHGEQTRVA
jgi:hypothetical protein